MTTIRQSVERWRAMGKKDLEQHVPRVHFDSGTRRFPRRAVERVALERPIRGQILDLSQAGFGVETREPLRVLRQGVFTLSTPRARPEFLGEVRWCRLTEMAPLPDGQKTPVYRAGIAVIER